MLRLSSVHRALAAAFRSPVSLSLLLVGLAPACIDGFGSGKSPSGSVSDYEMRECKDACGQLKFFDCADAADHASCFSACEAATSSAIDVFVSCVQADICDPECVGDLVQTAKPPSGDGNGDGNGDGSVSDPDACVDACEAFVGDGCIEPIDCGAACASLPESERSFVAYCESRRDGCELPDECAGELEADPAADCQDACDSLLFFDCVDAEQHSSCRSLCGSVSSDVRDTFAACAGDGICTDAACFEVLEGGGGGGGEGGGVGEGEGGSVGDTLQEICGSGCDDMVFWDCIDASQHAECRSRCDAAEDARIETFLGCLGVDAEIGGLASCEDSSCYDIFVTG